MNDKKNKSNSTLGYVPQSNLHGKILDIVNNRINPKKQQLLYQNGNCMFCVEPSQKQQKKIKNPKGKQQSRNTKDAKQKQHKNSRSFMESKIAEGQRPSLGFGQTKNLIRSLGRKLCLCHNIISIQIQANVTKEDKEDQQKQNAVISQLQLQIRQKDSTIVALQRQLQLNKQEIKELNKDIQSIQELARNKAYSDNHLHNNDCFSQISMDPPPSLKDVIMTDFLTPSSNNKISFLPSIEHIYDSPYQFEHLIRIICTQAKELERQKVSIDLIKNSSIIRPV